MRSHADICTAKYRAKYGRFRYSHQSRRTFGYHCRCCLWNAGTFTRHLRFPTLEVLLLISSLLLLYNLELFCRSLCSIFQHLKVSRKIGGEENKESKEKGSWVFSFQVFWWIFRTYLSSPKLTLLEGKVGPKFFWEWSEERTGGSIHHPSKLGKAEVRSSKLFPSVLGETWSSQIGFCDIKTGWLLLAEPERDTLLLQGFDRLAGSKGDKSGLANNDCETH